MVGTSANEDIQRLRLALFARYIDQLYTDTFEDWARTRPEELMVVAQEALAVTRWHRGMEAGSSFLDAWIEAHQEQNRDKWYEILHSLDDQEVTQFLKTPATEEIVRNCAFARFTPWKCPRIRCWWK